MMKVKWTILNEILRKSMWKDQVGKINCPAIYCTSHINSQHTGLVHGLRLLTLPPIESLTLTGSIFPECLFIIRKAAVRSAARCVRVGTGSYLSSSGWRYIFKRERKTCEKWVAAQMIAYLKHFPLQRKTFISPCLRLNNAQDEDVTSSKQKCKWQRMQAWTRRTSLFAFPSWS